MVFTCSMVRAREFGKSQQTLIISHCQYTQMICKQLEHMADRGIERNEDSKIEQPKLKRLFILPAILNLGYPMGASAILPAIRQYIICHLLTLNLPYYRFQNICPGFGLLFIHANENWRCFRTKNHVKSIIDRISLIPSIECYIYS